MEIYEPCLFRNRTYLNAIYETKCFDVFEFKHVTTLFWLHILKPFLSNADNYKYNFCHIIVCVYI